jgi:peptidyl-tRNA hydrolase, PTH1 family
MSEPRPPLARRHELDGVDDLTRAGWYHPHGPSRMGSGPFDVRPSAAPRWAGDVTAAAPRNWRDGDTVKIVVGLGNPGERYAKTRHNIGWMVVDRLADRAGWVGKGRERDASRIVQGRFRGLDLTLARPLTFMNESGLAVRKVIAREHAPLGDLLVVADDFALPFGKLRFREGGGPGGHNGLLSIIDELGTEKFSRLRVGIGEPERNAVDHVLSTFAPAERQRLDELLDAAADAVEAWARDGPNKAANRFNAFLLRPADEERLAPPGAVDGPPGPDGIRRTRTGWRRLQPPGPGEET